MNIYRRRLINLLRNAPSGFFLKKVLSFNWSSILCIFITLWLTLSLSFGYLYLVDGGLWDASGNEGQGAYVDNFTDALYFSTITQTTVGYGDIVPKKGDSRLLVIIQLSIASIIIATAFSIFVSKIVEPGQKIIFPQYLCYDNVGHSLLVWCLNKDKSPLYSFNNSIGVETISTHHDRDTRNIRYNIKIHKQQSYIGSMDGFVIKSDPIGTNNNDLRKKLSCHTENNTISAVSCDEYGKQLLSNNGDNNFTVTPVITVEVKAKSELTGKDIFYRKTYPITNIVCGKTKDLGPKEDPKPQKWYDRMFENYGGIDKTTWEECQKCSLHHDCPLKYNRNSLA